MATRDTPEGLPAALIRRAEALLSGDASQWEAPPTADAATVILLADSPDGPQIFLQRRVGTMKFAAGMYVFPGGRVEDSDADPGIPWRPGRRHEPFSRPTEPAATAHFRALTSAAARETWEEASVVLAVSASGAPIPEAPAEATEDLAAWLGDRGGKIDAQALRPWAHWVTPEVERHRYDTRFLVAQIPEGQLARDLGVESAESLWLTAGTALDRVAAGQLPMLPPTVDALQQLADFDTVASILAVADLRTPDPLLPKAQRAPDGSVEWVLVDAYSGEVLRRW